MKTWIISMTLLCAAGVARANGMPDAAPAPAAEPAAAPAKTARHKPARMPRGDLRHCLDLGSNAAIIRCTEKPAKR